MNDADDRVLHRYQHALIELLRAGTSPEAIVAALLVDPDLAPLHAYVRGLDRHALVVAAQIVAKWSPTDDGTTAPER